MNLLIQKARTAKTLFRSNGLGGLKDVLNQNISVRKRRILKWWRGTDHWWIGKWVEVTGNNVVLDDCRFSVNSPLISTSIKSRFVLDLYEKPEREAVKSFLNPALPVVELGGGLGIVSCLANKILRNPSNHIVVEANSHLIALLQENRDRNACQFTILNQALAYSVDTVSFHLHSEFIASSIMDSTCPSVQVKPVTLASILDSYNFQSATVICDIEGQETELVRNEAACLRERVGMLIVETHPQFVGEELVGEMLDTLKEFGFTIARQMSKKTYVLQNTKVKG